MLSYLQNWYHRYHFSRWACHLQRSQYQTKNKIQMKKSKEKKLIALTLVIPCSWFWNRKISCGWTSLQNTTSCAGSWKENLMGFCLWVITPELLQHSSRPVVLFQQPLWLQPSCSLCASKIFSANNIRLVVSQTKTVQMETQVCPSHCIHMPCNCFQAATTHSTLKHQYYSQWPITAVVAAESWVSTAADHKSPQTQTGECSQWNTPSEFWHLLDTHQKDHIISVFVLSQVRIQESNWEKVLGLVVETKYCWNFSSKPDGYSTQGSSIQCHSLVVCGTGPRGTRPHNHHNVQHCSQKQSWVGRTTAVE